jgi:hypothetical protein
MKILLASLLALFTIIPAFAADVTGTWTASGKAKPQNGESDIKEGTEELVAKRAK